MEFIPSDNELENDVLKEEERQPENDSKPEDSAMDEVLPPTLSPIESNDQFIIPPSSKRRKRNTSIAEPVEKEESGPSNRTRKRKAASVSVENSNSGSASNDVSMTPKETKEASISSFIQTHSRTRKVSQREQKKAFPLSEVNLIMEKEKGCQLGYCLLLMMFLWKNVITVDKAFKKGKRLSFVTDEGAIAFRNRLKKNPNDEDLKILTDRMENPYWKLPSDDDVKILSLLENHSNVQIILNGVELVKFPDKTEPGKMVKCLMPSFRYEPVLKRN